VSGWGASVRFNFGRYTVAGVALDYQFLVVVSGKNQQISTTMRVAGGGASEQYQYTTFTGDRPVYVIEVARGVIEGRTQAGELGINSVVVGRRR